MTAVWVCTECGGPITGEVIEDFFLPGTYCSDGCVDAARERDRGGES